MIAATLNQIISSPTNQDIKYISLTPGNIKSLPQVESIVRIYPVVNRALHKLIINLGWTETYLKTTGVEIQQKNYVFHSNSNNEICRLPLLFKNQYYEIYKLNDTLLINNMQKIICTK